MARARCASQSRLCFHLNTREKNRVSRSTIPKNHILPLLWLPLNVTSAHVTNTKLHGDKNTISRLFFRENKPPVLTSAGAPTETKNTSAGTHYSARASPWQPKSRPCSPGLEPISGAPSSPPPPRRQSLGQTDLPPSHIASEEWGTVSFGSVTPLAIQQGIYTASSCRAHRSDTCGVAFGGTCMGNTLLAHGKMTSCHCQRVEGQQ